MTVYADLFRYRELFGNLFRRDLNAKYKGSVLGVVWVLIPPLVLMGVYLLVFHYLWRTTPIPHYTLYLLAGLASWVFFSTTIQAGSRAMLDNAPLIRRSRFPSAAGGAVSARRCCCLPRLRCLRPPSCREPQRNPPPSRPTRWRRSTAIHSS